MAALVRHVMQSGWRGKRPHQDAHQTLCEVDLPGLKMACLQPQPATSEHKTTDRDTASTPDGGQYLVCIDEQKTAGFLGGHYDVRYTIEVPTQNMLSLQNVNRTLR